MEKYQNKDLSAEERAADLLGKLSLDEKMAQVNCLFLGRGGKYEENLIEYGIGEVSCLEMRGDKLENALRIQRDVQTHIMRKSPHKIPAIFHMEGLCGLLVNGAACFPSNIMRGASFDPDLEYEIGKCIGDQASVAGISHVFAPVLDITRDARFGRMYESYGEDAVLASEMGTAYTKGLQQNSGRAMRVGGVAKHFLAFHKGSGGLHGSDVSIGERELQEVYAKPFEAAIRQGGLMGIMPCYNAINGEAASGSRKLLDNLLRKEMGFQGVVVADYSAIRCMVEANRLAGEPAEAGLRSMTAGIDVEQQNVYGFGAGLKELFETGKADIDILNNAVLRVLETKFRMGLFEHPFADETVANSVFTDAKGEELSRRSAREGIVLLKNDGILPLKGRYKKIAVIGYHGNTVRGMFGGYTNFSMYEGFLGDQNTMAGLATNGKEIVETYPGTFVKREDSCVNIFEEAAKRVEPNAKTLTQAFQEAFRDSVISYAVGYDYAGNDESGFAEAIETAADADLIVLVLGGKCGTGALCSMGENINATSIGLPPAQEKFIALAATLKKPMIGVHFDGRPVSSDNADKYLNALVEGWNPSRYGAEAIVDILCGKYVPAGRLPVSIAYNAGQLPMYYGHPFNSSYHLNEFYKSLAYMDCPLTPRYPFGFGLSYTKFRYSSLAVNKACFRAGEDLIISAEIENIGETDGEEVVQLYYRDCIATVAQPNLSLMGFIRLPVGRGEKKRVTFYCNINQFAFLDESMRWKVEKGEIQLFVGPSSANLPLHTSITIEEDAFIRREDRAFYPGKSAVTVNEV